MYKSIIVLAVAATLLTACNNEEESNQTVKSKQVEQKSTGEENQKIEPTQREANQMTTANQDKWSSLPEYNSLMKQVGNGDYTFSTVTDNRGKRVLLLKGNDKEFKSIFVKETNRLKIINTNDDGEIFNSVI